jgi:hypothetical protein
VSQKPTIINPMTESPKKCFRCGLINFTDKTRCARCDQELSQPLSELESNQHVPEDSAESARFKLGVVVTFVVVLLVGLIWLYVRKDPQRTPEAVAEAGFMQPATEQAEQPGQVIAQANPQSREAAKQVLTGLKRFQATTNSSMSYEEYDAMLTRLKSDLHSTLPSFVDHNPGDETFRLEVEAAIRDYTAAQNWWKTINRNSSVFSDADRTERLIPSWTSAKTHIEQAERALTH